MIFWRENPKSWILKVEKDCSLDKKCSFRTVCYLFFSSQSTLYQYSIERSQWKAGQRIGIYQSCRNLEIRARDHQWTKRFRHFSAWHPRQNPELLCQQLLRYSPIVCFSRFPVVSKTQVDSATWSREEFSQPEIFNFLGLFLGPFHSLGPEKTTNWFWTPYLEYFSLQSKNKNWVYLGNQLS